MIPTQNVYVVINGHRMRSDMQATPNLHKRELPDIQVIEKPTVSVEPRTLGVELTPEEWLEAQRQMKNIGDRNYMREHHQDTRKRSAQFFVDHPEYAQQYRDKNPEYGKLCSERRRARIAGNTKSEDMLTEVEWQDILKRYNHRCAYCGRKLGYGKDELRPTMDHVQPVTRNGQHTRGNIVPACKHCNSVKSAKTPQEWVGLSI